MGRLPAITAGLCTAILLAGCADADPSAESDSDDGAADTSPGDTDQGPGSSSDPGSASAGGKPFTIEEYGSYDSPWALEFLPGTEQMLISTRTGELLLRSTEDSTDPTEVSVEGLPENIVVDGQGGLGDVVVAPDFEESQRVYLSWVAAGEGGTGAVVGHARLVDSGSSAQLQDLTVIWEQSPKTSGSGHFSHRLAFSADGEHLFVTSGDRQQMTPAQDLSSGLGKVMRLTPEGEPADGNPYAEEGGVSAEIWTWGHRNPLGIDVTEEGQLWSSEMGPEGGDELNLLQEGENHGWPEASNGSHYGGGGIPDHRQDDGFAAPATSWTPSISPGSLMIYQGELFSDWTGDAFLGALSGQALVRVDLDGDSAGEEQIWDMGARIRDVEEAPDGSIWVVEDGDGAALLRLTPPA